MRQQYGPSLGILPVHLVGKRADAHRDRGYNGALPARCLGTQVLEGVVVKGDRTAPERVR